MTTNTLAQFQGGQFYHVYNRTNNRESLFKEEKNRIYFIKLIQEKLIDFVDVYAFALLDNHFHLCICVKEENEIKANLKSKSQDRLTQTQLKYLQGIDVTINDLLVKQFSNLFNSYAQAINKMYRRNGNFFYRPFKRSHLWNKDKILFNQYYIHHNSRKHGIITDFLTDNWHSYHLLISDENTFLQREKVFEFFGSKQNFIDFHSIQHASVNFRDVMIED